MIFNIPNILTMFRIVLIPIVIQRFSVGDVRMAGILFLIACATDILDGLIARKFHMVTDVGKLLDPLADKGMQLSVLICMWYFADIIPLWAVLLFLTKELLMMIGGIVLLENKIIMGAKWCGKAATVITSVVVMVLMLFYQVLKQGVQSALIVIASAAALVALLLYASMFVKLLSTERHEHTDK